MSYFALIAGPESSWRTRYPETVPIDGRFVRIREQTDPAPGEAVGFIVDVVEPFQLQQALTSGLPTLVDVETIARVLARGEFELPAEGWHPYLPLAMASDVVAVTELLAEETIGDVTLVDITTFVGPVSGSLWDNDAPFATTAREATVFGVDLISRFLGDGLSSTQVVAGSPNEPGCRLVHRTRSGTCAVHTVLHADHAPSPLIEAAMTGSEGRLLLRTPFAPSVVTIWENHHQRFRCLSLPVDKPNVQSPDTWHGGIEVASMLASLVSPSNRQQLPTPDDAISAVSYVLNLGDQPQSTDHEPKIDATALRKTGNEMRGKPS